MGKSWSSPCPPTAVLETRNGPIRGVQYAQLDGRIVNAYLGIPYAAPPIGELRFKKPQPAEPWTEVLECDRFGPRAPQDDELFAALTNTVGKDEARCLTLNVFAPDWTDDNFPSGLPVMVYIHGGGFTIHSSSNYGDITIARNLCTRSVVVVTLNYRLGIYGFFTTGDEKCRGNFGLWDMRLALHWVKDNISRFGGDPNCITLFGQSAGGASVDLLSISPHTRDLFQRVIPMGGCGECDFALRTRESQATLGREFARFLGYKGEDSDSEAIIEFLKSQPVSKLELGFKPRKGFHHSQAGNLYFVPNYDGDFFPRPPSELRREAPRKDVMCGTTHFEGLLFVTLGGMAKSLESIRKFTSVMYKECDFGEHAEDVRKEVYDFYVRDIDPKDKHSATVAMIKLLGDYAINVGVFNYARTMASLNHNVYFYSFEYCNHDGFGLFGWFMPFKAATHCTELRYVLGKGIISKFKPNENDLKMIDIMTTYFTNFAKYGNPNGSSNSSVSSYDDSLNTTDSSSVDNSSTRSSTHLPPASASWLPHSPDTPLHHFRIDLPVSAMADNYQEKRPLFFDKILKRNRSRANL